MVASELLTKRETFTNLVASIQFDGSSDPPNDALPLASDTDAGLGASSSGTLLTANELINKDKSFICEQGIFCLFLNAFQAICQKYVTN